MDAVEEDAEKEKEISDTSEKTRSESSAVQKNNEDEFNSVSQKDYVPTPYRQSAWEGIEQYDFNASFHGISLDVVATDHFKADPMFEVFQDTLGTPTFEQYRSELDLTEKSPVEIPEELLEEARKVAFQEGVEKGRAEAEARYSRQIIALEEQYHQKKSELQLLISTMINEKVSTIEKRALELSLAVSRKVLETTVDVRPDYIFEVIQKALYSVPGAKVVTVKLSPEDYEFVSVEGIPDNIAELPVEVTYAPDESIVSGCVVESEFGTINLEIDHMWNEIKQNLFKMVDD